MKFLLFLLLPFNLAVAQSDPGSDDIIEEDGSLGTFQINTEKKMNEAENSEQQAQKEEDDQKNEPQKKDKEGSSEAHTEP